MTMDTITPHTTVPQPARMAATGSHPLCLGLEHGLWLVDGAAVDLFLARVDAGGRPSSALHGLWRAEPGSVLWGANELRLGEWSLLAIGAPGHHLHWLGSDVAQARAAGGPQPADWVNAVDGWFAALGVAARVSDGTLPVVHDPLEAAQPAEQGEPGEFLLDGRLATIQRRGAWLQLAEGTVELPLPEPALPLAVEPGDWLPCPAGAQLVVSTASRVRWIGTARWLREAAAAGGVARLHTGCMTAMMLARVIESGLDADDRMQGKRSREGVALAAATRELAGVLEPAAGLAPGHAPDSTPREHAWAPLMAALGRLAGTVGFVPATPPGMPLLHEEAQTAQPGQSARPAPSSRLAWGTAIRAAAEAAHIRYRRVTLGANWQHDDAGPLLAFMGPTQRPVALLMRGGRYWCLDPQDGDAPLTPACAAALHKAAFSLHAGFGDAPVTLLTLARRGLRGLGTDIRTVLVCGAVLALLALAVPLALGWLAGQAIPSGDRGQVQLLGLALLGSALATALFEVTRGIAHVRIESRLESALQAGIWDRLLRLPVPFFRQYTAGDLGERGVGLSRIRLTLSGATVSAALAAVFSLVNLAVLFLLDSALAGVAVLLVAAMLGGVGLLASRALREERRLAGLAGVLSGRMLQWLGGIARLRATGTESRALWSWAQMFARQQRHQLNAQLAHSGILTLQAAFPALASLVLFAAVSGRLADGSLDAGRFLAFMAAFGALSTALMAAAAALTSTLNVVPLVERGEADPRYIARGYRGARGRRHAHRRHRTGACALPLRRRRPRRAQRSVADHPSGRIRRDRG
jgi:hypothetical protein